MLIEINRTIKENFEVSAGFYRNHDTYYQFGENGLAICINDYRVELVVEFGLEPRVTVCPVKQIFTVSGGRKFLDELKPIEKSDFLEALQRVSQTIANAPLYAPKP